MADPKAQQEPSMEEILASIRRIISEDDEEGGEEAPVAEAVADEPAEASAEAPADEPAEPPAAADDDDVLELTEEIQDDGTVASLGEDDVEMIDAGDEEPGAAEADDAMAPPSPESVAGPTAPPIGPEAGLVSTPAASAATATFAGLASVVENDRLSGAAGIGGRTVEDLVKEVVRPIVKEWLDANLPALVERLVSREIDRMSRRAEE